jgi:hypothetical protein
MRLALSKAEAELAKLKAELDMFKNKLGNMRLARNYAEHGRNNAERELAKVKVERDALLLSGLNQAPCMYARFDKYGKPFFDETCVAEHPAALGGNDEQNILPLYTGPQVIKMSEQRDALAEALRDARSLMLVTYKPSSAIFGRIDALLREKDGGK